MYHKTSKQLRQSSRLLVSSLSLSPLCMLQRRPQQCKCWWWQAYQSNRRDDKGGRDCSILPNVATARERRKAVEPVATAPGLPTTSSVATMHHLLIHLPFRKSRVPLPLRFQNCLSICSFVFLFAFFGFLMFNSIDLLLLYFFVFQ